MSSQPPQPTEFAAFIGIDWADRKHDFCLHPAAGGKRERGVFEHKPEAITEWANRLRERFAGAAIAVAVELSQGPIVSALLEHDVFVIFPVNPNTLAKYRSAFKPSRAKDDPTDAEVALEILVHHRDKLTPLSPQSADMRVLRQLVESRRSLVHDRVRITNRITAALKEFYPQPLDWFEHKDTGVFAAFLERWPSLPDVQRAKDKALVEFFQAHHVRYPAVIQKRIAAIRAAKALTTDRAVIVPAQMLVRALLPQLRAVSEAIEAFNAEIERLCEKLPDYDLFRNLPGAGPVLSARLLAAFGEQRERFPTAYALQCFAGVAPVTERSGNKNWVHWRFSCSTFLRQTFVEWSAESIAKSFWARAFYEQARERGMSRHAALRALAFKWIRILFRCWQDRRPYDESHYLSALQKRHSPLLKFAAEK